MKTAFGIASALLMASGFGVSMPAQAQGDAPNAIVIFGEDTCPRGTICVRAPESERYRIPEALRGDNGLSLAERWGDRAKSIEYAGASGIQSCSPVGAGGASGCFSQLARAARAERRGEQ